MQTRPHDTVGREHESSKRSGAGKGCRPGRESTQRHHKSSRHKRSSPSGCAQPPEAVSLPRSRTATGSPAQGFACMQCGPRGHKVPFLRAAKPPRRPHVVAVQGPAACMGLQSTHAPGKSHSSSSDGGNSQRQGARGAPSRQARRHCISIRVPSACAAPRARALRARAGHRVAQTVEGGWQSKGPWVMVGRSGPSAGDAGRAQSAAATHHGHALAAKRGGVRMWGPHLRCHQNQAAEAGTRWGARTVALRVGGPEG